MTNAVSLRKFHFNYEERSEGSVSAKVEKPYKPPISGEHVQDFNNGKIGGLE